MLDVSLVGELLDHSVHAIPVTAHGDAHVDEVRGGTSFDGDGDYVTIEHFQYADDATFTIAFWMTKEDCTSNPYEYLYSHNEFLDRDIDDESNSNVNIYMGCEEQGGGWSDAGGGSILRYNIVGNDETWGRMDYPLHDAGSFDTK